jgi:hypothetical protein
MDDSSGKVAVETRENRNNQGGTNATNTNKGNEDDVMLSCNAKMGYIKVRFITGNSKGFNVARALKKFMAAARGQDDEFTILPLAGIGKHLCSGADVPNSKDGIEKYFRHDVNFNSINGKLRTHTSQDIGQLNRGRSKFRVYIKNNRVYINRAQLGEEYDITLGWTWKAHPDICYRNDMKEDLYSMMGEEFKGEQYAFFPKTIKYKKPRME